MRATLSSRTLFLFAIGGTAVGAPLFAQENYEIQVYGAETVAPKRTMVELHSNYTLGGRSDVVDGLLPTNHAFHETLEITHGFSDWLEVGVYVFTSARSGQGWQWVGDHVRPRVRVPENWGWPLGVSISQEVGYQRRAFSPDTWTYELRPIVDKKLGRWYGAFNPAVDVSLRGENAGKGFNFSPNATVGIDVTPKLNLAAEYYGSLGLVTAFDPIADQQHQLFGGVNVDFGPEWEFNFAYGQALTAGGDRRLVKMILGRRLAW
ncbi:MAG: hypothetical protein NVS4B3_04830 [Gemmatimonadaceae bacterium]